MTDFLKPVNQPIQSEFTPLPVDDIFRTTQILQRRQDEGLDRLDAISEFEQNAKILEEDRELLADRTSAVRNDIAAIADEGFVGDRLRGIRTLSRNFQREFDPFLRNKQAFDASKQAILEDETLSESDKARRISAIQRGLGLRVNEETGKIDENSIFGGRNFASRTDFDELVSKQLTKLKSEGRQGLPQIDPNTGLLVSTDVTFNSPDRVKAIARQTIFNSPEAVAFLQDEVRLAMEEAEAEGREFTAEDQNRVVEETIDGAVGNAINTFAFKDVKRSFRNPPKLGETTSSTGEEQQLAVPIGNIKIRDISSAPSRVRELRSTVSATRAKLQSGEFADEAERVGLEAQLKAQETDLKNEQALVDLASREEGVSSSIVEEIRATQPPPPTSLSDAEIKEIENQAKGNSGFFGDILAKPSELFTKVFGKDNNFQSEREQYFNEYRSWFSSLSAAEKDIDTRISDRLSKIQEREFESIHGTAMSIPSKSKLTGMFRDAMNVKGLDSGFEMVNSDGTAFEEGDEPFELDTIANVSTLPVDNGRFVIFANGKKGEKVKIFVDPKAKGNFTEILAKDLLKTAGNSQTQKAVAYNLLFPDVADDLMNQVPGVIRSNFGNLSDESMVVDGVQLGLKRNSGGSFTLVNAETGELYKTNNGQSVSFSGASEANINFIIPLLEKQVSSK